VSTASAPSVTRIALRPAEAAHALSVSRDFFVEHVLPELRVIRRGRLVLIPVSELQRWCERNAARTLEGYGPS
jgi:excisionase family DNA binding protein